MKPVLIVLRSFNLMHNEDGGHVLETVHLGINTVFECAFQIEISLL